jgi:hypothetical protein
MTTKELLDKYMNRQLTLSAVLGTGIGENPAVLLDVRYKLDLLCRAATVQLNEEFDPLGEYERGTRICFMATIGQWKDPRSGKVLNRLHKFKRAYVVP